MRWRMVCTCVAIATSAGWGNEIDLEAATPPPTGGLAGAALLRDAGDASQLELRWTADPETPVTLSGKRTKPDTWWFALPQRVAEARAPKPGMIELMNRVGRRAAGRSDEGGVTTAQINLQEGPDANSAVAETVEPGTRLELTGRSDGSWLELRRRGRTLWAQRSDVVDSADSSASLELIRRDATSFWAIVRENGKVRSRQLLSGQERRALLVNVGGNAISDGPALRRALDPVERHYRAQGYEVVRFSSLSPNDLIAKLEAEQERPFTRVVFSSHSGWEGPVWLVSGRAVQLSAGSPRFTLLAERLNQATAPEARIYVSGCHAAGSNRYERADPRIWVRDLATGSGRTVGGPTGITNAAEHTLRQTLAVLEGEGSVVQESVLATAQGELRRWGGGLQLQVTPLPGMPVPDTRSDAQRFVDEDDAEAEASEQLGLGDRLRMLREELLQLEREIDWDLD